MGQASSPPIFSASPLTSWTSCSPPSSSAPVLQAGLEVPHHSQVPLLSQAGPTVPHHLQALPCYGLDYTVPTIFKCLRPHTLDQLFPTIFKCLPSHSPGQMFPAHKLDDVNGSGGRRLALVAHPHHLRGVMPLHPDTARSREAAAKRFGNLDICKHENFLQQLDRHAAHGSPGGSVLRRSSLPLTQPAGDTETEQRCALTSGLST
jgi:hypothetical protein